MFHFLNFIVAGLYVVTVAKASYQGMDSDIQQIIRDETLTLTTTTTRTRFEIEFVTKTMTRLPDVQPVATREAIESSSLPEGMGKVWYPEQKKQGHGMTDCASCRWNRLCEDREIDCPRCGNAPCRLDCEMPKSSAAFVDAAED
ncbi:hypothetical protein M433DRAFT_130996 [Acidomyces richmondensis BFW]|nr:MAG: hypothetical protein FE78DRAFT_80956 [Acidomyces sp. 'richmondensis']KYG49734.1 hypothetical protein M433DRAFT_130996 [Acidomyces richmondensis BFW]